MQSTVLHQELQRLPNEQELGTACCTYLFIVKTVAKNNEISVMFELIRFLFK